MYNLWRRHLKVAKHKDVLGISANRWSEVDVDAWTVLVTCGIHGTALAWHFVTCNSRHKFHLRSSKWKSCTKMIHTLHFTLNWLHLYHDDRPLIYVSCFNGWNGRWWLLMYKIFISANHSYTAFLQHFGSDVTSASFGFNILWGRVARLTHAARRYATAQTQNKHWFYVTSLLKYWWSAV